MRCAALRTPEPTNGSRRPSSGSTCPRSRSDRVLHPDVRLDVRRQIVLSVDPHRDERRERRPRATPGGPARASHSATEPEITIERSATPSNPAPRRACTGSQGPNGRPSARVQPRVLLGRLKRIAGLQRRGERAPRGTRGRARVRRRPRPRARERSAHGLALGSDHGLQRAERRGSATPSLS